MLKVGDMKMVTFSRLNMVGQFGALVDTSEFTDMVYMVCPTGNQPWVSKQQNCIIPIS